MILSKSLNFQNVPYCILWKPLLIPKVGFRMFPYELNKTPSYEPYIQPSLDYLRWFLYVGFLLPMNTQDSIQFLKVFESLDNRRADHDIIEIVFFDLL